MISAVDAKALADTSLIREMMHPEHTYFALEISFWGFTLVVLRLYSCSDALRFSLVEVERDH
ncbi:hypothetical protein LCGC14_2450130 [marine sediment metagenome]|uniref:Uncharacterized protein n=1 Tax=marine sediment metagenome TaxID=412755 RepID=A0A0F9EA84_9ZZZZ